MQHCDDETLALLALGEPAAGLGDEEHLDRCRVCRDTLVELQSVVKTARATQVEDRPVPPPAAVWDRITAELGLSGTVDGPMGGLSSELSTAVPAANVVPLDSRRSRQSGRPGGRAGWLAAAAAVVGVLAGVGGTVLVKNADQATAPAVSILARTALDPLDAPAARGTAVVEEHDGMRSLTVDVQGLALPADSFYQVWLIDKGVTKMVAVGVLNTAEHGTFDVPSSLDLSAFPVVDVSLQPMNGNPAHSSVSVVRGVLPA